MQMESVQQLEHDLEGLEVRDYLHGLNIVSSKLFLIAIDEASITQEYGA